MYDFNFVATHYFSPFWFFVDKSNNLKMFLFVRTENSSSWYTFLVKRPLRLFVTDQGTTWGRDGENKIRFRLFFKYR